MLVSDVEAAVTLVRDELQPGDMVLKAQGIRPGRVAAVPPKEAAAAMGVCVGFPRWNAVPAAEIFMDNTGSMALGELLPASE